MPSSARCTNSRAGQPAAAKRGAAQCDDHPDEVGTIRHGTAVANSQKPLACPKARQNRRLHRSADPRRARRATAPERAKRLFLFHRARRILFLGKTKKRMGGASRMDNAPWREPDPRGQPPAARLRQGLPYFKNSSTTPSMPGFSQVRSNRRALPFRAARRRGMAVPVVSCSWSSSSTPSPAGVSPMARNT